MKKKKATEALQKELFREPTEEEIIDRLIANDQDNAKAIRGYHEATFYGNVGLPLSFDQPLAETDDPAAGMLDDALADPGPLHGDQSSVNQDALSMLCRAGETMTDVQFKAFLVRYGWPIWQDGRWGWVAGANNNVAAGQVLGNVSRATVMNRLNAGRVNLLASLTPFDSLEE